MLEITDTISIPEREHGYGGFKSQVIPTQEKFDEFMKSTEKGSWNKKDEFVDALKKAKVDFAKETLVLIRQTEGLK